MSRPLWKSGGSDRGPNPDAAVNFPPWIGEAFAGHVAAACGAAAAYGDEHRATATMRTIGNPRPRRRPPRRSNRLTVKSMCTVLSLENKGPRNIIPLSRFRPPAFLKKVSSSSSNGREEAGCPYCGGCSKW
jgi:hypothetical protein